MRVRNKVLGVRTAKMGVGENLDAKLFAEGFMFQNIGSSQLFPVFSR